MLYRCACVESGPLRKTGKSPLLAEGLAAASATSRCSTTLQTLPTHGSVFANHSNSAVSASTPQKPPNKVLPDSRGRPSQYSPGLVLRTFKRIRSLGVDNSAPQDSDRLRSALLICQVKLYQEVARHLVPLATLVLPLLYRCTFNKDLVAFSQPKFDMAIPTEIARLVLRQAEEAADDTPSPGHCVGNNEYDGRMGIRISSIFVILIGSVFGEYIFRHVCNTADSHMKAPSSPSLLDATASWVFRKYSSSLPSTLARVSSSQQPSSIFWLLPTRLSAMSVLLVSSPSTRGPKALPS